MILSTVALFTLPLIADEPIIPAENVSPDKSGASAIEFSSSSVILGNQELSEEDSPEQTEETTADIPIYQNYENRVFIGYFPNFEISQHCGPVDSPTDPEDIKKIKEEGTPIIFVSVKPGLSGIAYERVKKDAFYWSIASVLSPKSKVFGVGAYIGYNFKLDPRKTLTPYVGSTYIRVNNIRHGKVFMEQAGLKFDQAVNDLFSFGFDFSLCASLSKNFTYGFTADTTLSCHLGEARNWDITFMPYHTRVENAFCEVTSTGVQVSLGYRF